MGSLRLHTHHAINQIKMELHHITWIIDHSPENDETLELKGFKQLQQRLQSALEIVDGTKSAKFSAIAKEKQKSGKLNPKGSKLDKHHDRIVEAVNAGMPIAMLATELEVQVSTVYRYLKKIHIK